MTSGDQPSTPHWLFLLRAQAQRAQARREKHGGHELTPLERSEKQIIGGAFLRWFRDDLPVIQSNRAYLSALDPYPPLPFLVVTSTPVGTDAVHSAVSDHPRLFTFTRTEFDALPAGALPPAKAMIHYWSYFEAPEGALARQAQLLHLNIPLHEMTVHHVGHRFNETAGNEAWHLWHKTSDGYRLLTENLLKSRT